MKPAREAIGETLPLTNTLPTVVANLQRTRRGSRLSPEQQIQALEAALASTRLSTLFQGGIIGLALGGTTAYFVARNLARRQDEEDSDAEDDGLRRRPRIEIGASEGQANAGRT